MESNLKLILTFVFGFIAFCFMMEFFQIDQLFSSSGDFEESSVTFMQTRGTEIYIDENSTPLKMTKEQLGRNTWSLLHSLAASIPVEPSVEQKQKITTFIQLFSELYPCKSCAEHFRQILSENPVEVSSRVTFVKYMCKLHNIVNESLAKSQFDCSNASDKWGGDCGCDE